MNKLRHEGKVKNASAIALQAICFSDEFMQIHESPTSPLMMSSLIASPRLWKPFDLGILKRNTDMAFSKEKISMSIIVRLSAFLVVVIFLLIMVNY